MYQCELIIILELNTQIFCTLIHFDTLGQIQSLAPPIFLAITCKHTSAKKGSVQHIVTPPEINNQAKAKRSMYRKFREIHLCGFWDMLADRQTDRHIHTVTLITILRFSTGGGVKITQIINDTQRSSEISKHTLSHDASENEMNWAEVERLAWSCREKRSGTCHQLIKASGNHRLATD